MSGLETWVGALGLSFASGVNLYAAVLAVGLANRAGWLPFLSDELAILSEPWVLILAGVMYAAEFLADKIPWFNTLWDGVHTFIRPLGAALIALGAADQLGPAGKTAAALLGGSIALGSHAAKASARVLANTAAPEPVTQSTLSIAEDLGVFGLVALIFSYPWVALFVLIGLLAATAAVAPRLLRTIRFLARSALGLFGSRSSAGWAPAWLRARLESGGARRDCRFYPAFARSVPGLPSFCAGYLVVGSEGAAFHRKGLFGTATAEFRDVGPPLRERGLLCDVLKVRAAHGREARVCLTKDWSRLYRRLEGDAAGHEAFSAARA